MRNYFLGLLMFLLLLAGCSSDSESDYETSLPVDSNEVIYKKGDILAFKIDSLNYGAGIVFDFSKDEGGLWYSILLTDYESHNKPTIDTIQNGRFLGRKVGSSLDTRRFYIAIDVEHILDSLLTDNFILIGNVSLNNKVKFGSEGASSKMEGLIQKLKDGKERRLTPPDDYSDHLTKLNDFRPDEYFVIKHFIKQ